MEERPVRRYAAVVGLDPAKEALYRELHADVWPEVRAAIQRAHIHNLSILITELDGQPRRPIEMLMQLP
jgi:L-rhamnose mutarotase